MPRTGSDHRSDRALDSVGLRLLDRRIPEAAIRAGIVCYEKYGCEIRAAANLRSRIALGLRRRQIRGHNFQFAGFLPSGKARYQNTTVGRFTLSPLLASPRLQER